MNLRPLEKKALSEIKAFIDTHYTDALTLDSLCGRHWQGDEVSFRRRRLHEAFSSTYLQTISEYLATVRMEHAKTLLQTTDLSIRAIAAQVGYKGSTSFSTAFRRHVGVSPSVYRGSVTG
ncbi:MAG TPA: helix-turn-helix transcriptional regulator [Puia sp.]|nr:helix-turn-helix transcriptional regulator [Puia sp.]